MIKEPYCFGDYPTNPGVKSERECFTCRHETTCPSAKPLGRKADKQKPRASLLPLGILYQVIAVLEFGARRYAVDNWQHVPDARRRYYDAALRHIEAWWTGEQSDPESGQHHLAHACACLMFLMWFDGRGGDA